MKTTYLKNYKPSEFLIETIDLDIDIYDNYTTVKSILSCKKNPNSYDNTNTLILNGVKLSLKSIKLNNKLLTKNKYKVTSSELIIYKVPKSFKLEIIVKIEPHKNTELLGLYKSNNLYCTQCEAEGFRRITYYLDRPDVMAKFTTTIRANKKLYPVLLSNGNLIKSGDLKNDRHFATWKDPFKKPSYLFAVVAGDLVDAEDRFLTQSGKLVTIKLYTELENLNKTTHALKAIKKAFAWDEKHYGREYDLDVFMIVAVNDFNMGAMENKGLNIFNSKCVLASTQIATDQDFERIDEVVAHEYFHNWSGNRVTCRDWFQLSLKEGFTVFRDQQFSEDVTKSAGSRIKQFKALLTRQFIEDSGLLAHSVRPDSYVEIDNFYTATVYEKGAEIIRMLRLLLGEKLFRKATDLYFARHDGQAVTIEDFVQAMQDASGIDLSLFKLWYSQAGTPTVVVKQEYNKNKSQYKLKMEQKCPITPGQNKKLPMQIPIEISLLDKKGANKSNQLLSLTKDKQEFVFNKISEKPILSVLRKFSAPIKIETDHVDKELAFLAMHDNDDFARWHAVSRLKKNMILSLIEQGERKKQFKAPALLFETYEKILKNKTINMELKAEMLLLPSSEEILKYTKISDPDITYKVKNFFKTELAKVFQKDFYNVYKESVTNKSYVYEPLEVSKRYLKNVCLNYLLWLNNNNVMEIGREQFYKSDNMTDTIGVLQAINNVNSKMRKNLLEEFYNKWKSEPLVINKWLLLQATSELPTVIADVHNLLKHKAFDLKNPNNVYSLICGFGSSNPIRFHEKSGKGYEFVSRMVIKLDQINPQVAARVVNPFSQLNCYDLNRQKLMRKYLHKIKSLKKISKNLSEIIDKCLN